MVEGYLCVPTKLLFMMISLIHIKYFKNLDSVISTASKIDYSDFFFTLFFWTAEPKRRETKLINIKGATEDD